MVLIFLTNLAAARLAGAGEPMPDTLLPGLLRRAAVQRGRTRWLVGGLASVAAACIITLAVVLWPAPPSSSGRPVAGRPFAAVAPSPHSARPQQSSTEGAPDQVRSAARRKSCAVR